jgi:hypothetical protein
MRHFTTKDYISCFATVIITAMVVRYTAVNEVKDTLVEEAELFVVRVSCDKARKILTIK